MLRVFGRECDAYVSVQPCTMGEPVCADERTNNGEPFFFYLGTGALRNTGPCCSWDPPYVGPPLLAVKRRLRNGRYIYNLFYTLGC